jgi:hypothetical protein
MSDDKKPIDLEALIQSIEDDVPFEEPTVDPTPESKEEEPSQDPPQEEPKEEIEELMVDVKSTDTLPKEQQEPQENQPSVLEAYYEQLGEMDFWDLPEEFEFDGTEEKFKEAYELTNERRKNLAVQEVFEALPEEFQKAVQYGLQGGRSLQEFVGSVSDEIDYETVDTADPIMQKRLLREYFRASTKYNDNKIESFISKLEKLDSLEEEAEDAADYLKNYHERRREELLEQQRLQAQREQEEADRIRQLEVEAIDSADYLSNKQKKAIKAQMFNVTKRNNAEATGTVHKLGSVFGNPQHKVQLAMLLDLYDEQKGFDFSKLTQKGKNQAVNSIQRALEEKVGALTTNRTNNSFNSKQKRINMEEVIKHFE